MLIYATFNHRHLMPELMAENLESDEIRPGETIEEKVSLSERFGIWLSSATGCVHSALPA